jgi:pantetheine-phosphate adenylyltransferase
METLRPCVIGLGGSFDHFHKGHRAFLDFAIQVAQKCSGTLRIGVTTQEFIAQKQFSEQIESYEQRVQSVEKFFQEEKFQPQISYQIFPLNNAFGPTLADSTITDLVVTRGTLAGGEAINAKRVISGLSPLSLHVSEMVVDESGEEISSTRIRAGECSREGLVYGEIFAKEYILSEKQRDFFQQPQGNIVASPTGSSPRRYVVGDIVLETFLEKKWPLSIGVYDQRTKRNVYHSQRISQLQPNVQVKNLAGRITVQLSTALKKYINKKSADPTYIQIDGEEDLAAVALATLAPLGSSIYYGQPEQGIVEMIITEEMKEKYAAILRETAPTRTS